MSKKNILDLFKYIIKSYLQCFVTMSIIISIIGATLTNNLLWLLGYVFQLWISVEVTFLAIKIVCECIKKIKNK